MKTVFFGKSVLIAILFAGTLAAQEPNWSSGVVAVGPRRQALESMPMEQRPYRPLHFYGNTVRRLYYRGLARPTLTDLQQTVRALAAPQR